MPEENTKHLGLSRESMLTSETSSASFAVRVEVNPPARMKPKNPRQHAAQSMTLSGDVGPRDQVVCILRRTLGVIGSLFLREWSGVALCTPFKTYVSFGKAEYDDPALI